MATETWYVLEDGSFVSPSEVKTGKDGRLQHKNGAVKMRGDVPMTRSVDPEAEAAKVKTAPPEPRRTTRQLEAGDEEGGRYKTRGKE